MFLLVFKLFVGKGVKQHLQSWQLQPAFLKKAGVPLPGAHERRGDFLFFWNFLTRQRNVGRPARFLKLGRPPPYFVHAVYWPRVLSWKPLTFFCAH